MLVTGNSAEYNNCSLLVRVEGLRVTDMGWMGKLETRGCVASLQLEGGWLRRAKSSYFGLIAIKSAETSFAVVTLKQALKSGPPTTDHSLRLLTISKRNVCLFSFPNGFQTANVDTR